LWTDRQTDTTKLIVIFAKMRKFLIYDHVQVLNVSSDRKVRVA